uniref:phosphatidylinositol 3-kinase catalytic subunit type 3-like n=1 Tax=Ciona intestinalis TaxID=7719 RepID=UPI000180D29B|nr:phosphatidylinositol 3-kinase catalytic subunit type 3-like [Ciona intestinalis]XP_026691217.1 phosphatidylinositol 3-kinase catalytic subunit type 3-like [Ciona intestinalis]|eukprot:XP_002128077.1 phosphatidylinositol 3-kinase catalytic subunit type 3-like [Ciona intestinalis]
MSDNTSLSNTDALRPPISDRFHYVYSCDLDVNVTIKICSLEGSRPKRRYQELLADPHLKFSDSGEIEQEHDSHMYVTVQVFEDSKAICLPVQTAYRHYTTSPGRSLHSWNEWLKLPIRFSELPRHAVATVTVWDTHGPGKPLPVGGSTVPLFGKYGTFKKGRHDVCVWPDVPADGDVPTTTPYKAPPHASKQMTRLAKLTKKHREGHMTKVDWLDRLTFREIEVINEEEKKKQNLMYLMVEFPAVVYKDVNYSIVYFEKDGGEPVQIRTNPKLVVLPDHELLHSNLIEEKHHKLARSLRTAQHDLKPNAVVRDQLMNIVDYPISKNLSEEEEDLVWKFRYYLMHQKKALTKFLRCVTWERPQEGNVALQMLEKWAPIDVVDALELLSPRFQNPTVRSYAVKILSQTTDENLVLYLLQLVQALKYENFDKIIEGFDAIKRQETTIPRSYSNDLSPGEAPSVPDTGDLPKHDVNTMQASGSQKDSKQDMDLATFLIQRACKNSNLTNYFYWYVLVECEETEAADAERKKVTEMYVTVLRRFSWALLKGNRECKLRRSQLAGQQKFMDKLVRLMELVERDGGNRKKKIEKLRALLSAETEILENMNFSSFEALPLPLDPNVKVNGIAAEQANLFKSNLMPAKLPFKTTDGKQYITIFKHGDDLRQDQLILQIITLMDKLLQKENLDLKLTPYKVLATSCKHGFMQFIESNSVAEVLANEGSIQNFFRKHQPNDKASYGIEPVVMDLYVKSCAGYCVITYLLGVGDRHLDNLLLRKTGELFHIDFGYILGRDPKPLPPPMKLSKEMVEAMGGVNSDHYHEFRKHCYTAFLHLRRHANLILNLFSLMTDASVPDIALEPDKTVKKVQDKFLLELSDEEAVRNMQALIDESVSALFPAFVEQIHKFAQTWRK